MEKLFEEDEEVHETEGATLPSSPSAALHAMPLADDQELRTKNAAKSDWISREGRQDRAFKSGYRKRTSDWRASRTDADAIATTTRSKGGTTRLGYQTHYDVVDGGIARIILGVLASPSEVTENRPMLDLLWRAVFRWRLRPQSKSLATPDTARVKTSQLSRRPASRRTWRSPTSTSATPASSVPATSATMPKAITTSARPDRSCVCRNKDRCNRCKRYRVSPKVCNACEFKAKCTTSEHGRVLYRPFDEDFYERVRHYRRGTGPYEKALRKRAVWVEPLFRGGQREWQGMDRFRLRRRLKKVNIEALLVASRQRT